MLSAQDKSIINTLLTNNMITREQAQECIALWQNETQSGNKTTIASILVSKKYVTTESIVSVVRYITSTQTKPSAETKARELKQDERFGSYTVIKVLGRGGMGIVYQVADTLGNPYALKLMTSYSANAIKRFQREGKILFQLHHPNIIRFKDAGMENDKYFLVMDFVVGKPLDEYKQNQPLPVKGALAIIHRLAKALHYAHEQSIIHRDLKPANIMIDQNYEPILMDFGLTKVIDAQEYFTQTGALLGTPRYMSPEQALGQTKVVGPASDIYSLGIIFYELLTGNPTIIGNMTTNEMLKQIQEPVPPPPPSSVNSGIDERIDEICFKALKPHIELRYQNAGELALAIEQYLGAVPDPKTELAGFAPLSVIEQCLGSVPGPKSELTGFAAQQPQPQQRESTQATGSTASFVQQPPRPQQRQPSPQPMRTTAGFAQQERSQNTQTIEIGKHFKKYFIETELGRGGMGIVYKARDEELDRFIALKVILKQDIQEKQIERFRREASATAKLAHPNIVQIYDSETRIEPYYLAMEYIKGDSLSGMIHKQTLLSREIAEIIKKCAEGLHLAHRKDIVHRDIKPSNIMMVNKKTPKIMDFGLVKVTDKSQQLSQEGDMLGTLLYMAPEQANKEEIDGRADLYALGATLYEALTGKPPFRSENYFSLITKILREEPQPPRELNSDIPADLEAICIKCLEKLPAKRYKNCRELAQDLDNFLQNRPVMAKPITRFTKFIKTVQRNKVLTGAISTVVMAIVVTVSVYIVGLQEREKVERETAEEVRIALREANRDKDKAIEAKLEMEEQKKEAERQTDIATKARKEAERQIDIARKANNHTSLTLLSGYVAANNITKAYGILKDLQINKEDSWEWRWVKKSLFEKSGVYTKAKIEIGYKDYAHRIKMLYYNGTQRLDYTTSKNNISMLMHFAKNSNKLIMQMFQKNQVGVSIYNLQSEQYSFFPDFYRSCSFHPDGRRIATIQLGKINGRRDGKRDRDSIVILDTHSKKMHSFPHNNPRKYLVSNKAGTRLILKKQISSRPDNTFQPIHSIFSPDGKKLIGVYRYKRFSTKIAVGVREEVSIIIWDVKTRKMLYALSPYGIAYDQVIYLFCDLSLDGRTLAIAGEPTKKRSVAVWDLVNRKHQVLATTDSFKQCYFNSDGTLLAARGTRKIMLWQKKNNKWKLKQSILDSKGIKDFRFSQDSEKLIFLSGERKIVVWSIKEGKKINIFTDTLDKYISVAVKGNKIATLTDHMEVQFFRLNQAPNPIYFNTKLEQILYCTFHPDNKTIAVANAAGDGYFVHYFDLQKQEWKKDKHKNLLKVAPVRQCAFSPDGKQILLCGILNGILPGGIGKIGEIRSFPEDKVIFRLPNRYWQACAYSYDGKKIVCTSKRGAELYELPNSQPRKLPGKLSPTVTFIPFKKASSRSSYCKFSRDSTKIAISYDDRIEIWDASLSRNKQRRSPERRTSILRIDGTLCCDFSYNGRWIVTGGREEEIVLWDMSGKKLVEYKGHVGRVTQCMFLKDADGRDYRIVSIGTDGIMRIWRVPEIIHEIAGKGKVLEKFIEEKKPLLELNIDINPLETFEGGAGDNVPAFGLTVSSDGRKVAAGNYSGILKVWDVGK